MIELPESITLGKQLKETLTGKTITEVFTATHLHRFTFFHGDPADYIKLLKGKKILSAEGRGIFVNIHLTDNVFISIGDGVNMKFGDKTDKIPEKYQLLLGFDDDSFLSFNVAMYGGIYAYRGDLDNKYLHQSMEKLSPLSKDYDEEHFNQLFLNEKDTLSAKALLATQQRIPGVGNGVLQDILFNAKINPKRKIGTMSETEKKNLFKSLKNTLATMTEGGGRDTETDIFGNKGKYKTILSKNTYKNPCPECGHSIVKESYLGGTIYYCSHCQKPEKK